MVTVQSQAKFHKTGVKCVAFWRLALNSYHIFDFKRKKVYDNKESDKCMSYADMSDNRAFWMWKNRSSI